jgi:hypothetical protein
MPLSKDVMPAEAGTHDTSMSDLDISENDWSK